MTKKKVFLRLGERAEGRLAGWLLLYKVHLVCHHSVMIMTSYSTPLLLPRLLPSIGFSLSLSLTFFWVPFYFQVTLLFRVVGVVSFVCVCVCVCYSRYLMNWASVGSLAMASVRVEQPSRGRVHQPVHRVGFRRDSEVSWAQAGSCPSPI